MRTINLLSDLNDIQYPFDSQPVQREFKQITGRYPFDLLLDFLNNKITESLIKEKFNNFSLAQECSEEDDEPSSEEESYTKTKQKKSVSKVTHTPKSIGKKRVITEKTNKRLTRRKIIIEKPVQNKIIKTVSNVSNLIDNHSPEDHSPEDHSPEDTSSLSYIPETPDTFDILVTPITQVQNPYDIHSDKDRIFYGDEQNDLAIKIITKIRKFDGEFPKQMGDILFVNNNNWNDILSFVTIYNSAKTQNESLLYCWIYIVSSFKYHICGEQRQKNIYCMSCTKEIFRRIKGHDNEPDIVISNWVSSRRLAGKILVNLNTKLFSSEKIIIYCDASLRDLKKLSTFLKKVNSIDNFYTKLGTFLNV